MQVITTCIYLLTKNFICILYLFYDFDLKLFRYVGYFSGKNSGNYTKNLSDMLRVRQY